MQMGASQSHAPFCQCPMCFWRHGPKAKVMDLIYHDKLEAVLDHRTMSLIAPRKAKSRGKSWEKAQLPEVIAEPGSQVGPAGLADLFV